MAGNKNIWCIKPGALSRGRGVKNYSDLNEILTYAICAYEKKVDMVV